jgi:hypothetical protein
VNLQEHSRRVAVLKAIQAVVTDEYDAARLDAAAAYAANGIRSISVVLEDGFEAGSITVKNVGVTVTVEEAVLLEWAEAHTPSEVEEFLDPKALTDEEALGWAREHRADLLRRQVRPVWRTELVKQATKNGGYAVDPVTGETHKFAEVRRKPVTGEFAYTPTKHGPEIILAALQHELDALMARALGTPAGAPS